MIDLLVANPLLLLFIVAAIGYPLGRIRIRGSSLGVASVLFAGLAIGAIDPRLKLPEIIYLLGLVLFVYTIGLSSGPGFFASFRRKGVRDNLLVAGMLVVAAILTLIASRILDLQPALTAGLFSGSLTNTPALAAAIEALRESVPESMRARVLNEPVVGYSIAYPVGVIGIILAIAFTQRLWKVDYAREAQELEALGATSRPLHSRTIRVLSPEAASATLGELTRRYGWQVLFGRVHTKSGQAVASAKTRVAPGDLVTAVGTPEEIDRVIAVLGETSETSIDLDRTQVDYRRIFVSNPRIAGRTLSDLDLPGQFGAVMTRIRRGDVELLPSGSTTLELGDRVRVVAPRERIQAISDFFGDSYRALSEIDILSFSLGLSLGLLLGLLPIPLPGGITVRLGLAGGPLIAGLVLGRIGFTGRLVWTLPFNANLTLRQIGLVLFLAGVGTRAGYDFVTMITRASGLLLFAAGAIITCGTALLTLWIGHRLLHIPMSLLTGMLSGLQTQPAALGFAVEQTGNDLPNIGYATVYPVATISKIILVQLILAILSS